MFFAYSFFLKKKNCITPPPSQKTQPCLGFRVGTCDQIWYTFGFEDPPADNVLRRFVGDEQLLLHHLCDMQGRPNNSVVFILEDLAGSPS